MTLRIVSILTLGVTDLARSTAFYEGIGFQRSNKSTEEITWFSTGGTVLALYPWNELAEDATLPGSGDGHQSEERR